MKLWQYLDTKRDADLYRILHLWVDSFTRLFSTIGFQWEFLFQLTGLFKH